MTWFSRHTFLFIHENRHFGNKACVALNPLVLLFGRFVARGGRKRCNRRTNGQIKKSTEPRVNKLHPVPQWKTCCKCLRMRTRVCTLSTVTLHCYENWHRWYYTVEMLASGSDPPWDLPAMFGLHNVLSAHSFPYVEQDISICRRYYNCQNGEQVSRTVLTLCFQLVSRGAPRSWHAAVCARANFQVAPSNHEDWEEVGSSVENGPSAQLSTSGSRASDRAPTHMSRAISHAP